MASMKQGFYALGGNVYYGMFPENQVSGEMRIAFARPENIKTDQPFEEHTPAFRLWDNHGATEQEQTDLKNSLQIILQAAGIEKEGMPDFQKTEEWLGISLPQEVRTLHEALYGTDLFKNGFTDGKERFLTLDELYMDEGQLVFYKMKRTPVGLSLDTGTKMDYYKKEWFCERGGESFYSYVLNRTAVHAIGHMPCVRQGKVKGELRTSLRAKELLKNIYAGKLDILEEYRNYGNVLLYQIHGALCWFRQNGFYADILIGTQNEELMREISSVEAEIVWDGTKSQSKSDERR